MDTSHLLVERRDAQCRITIQRVDKHNALSRDVLAQLADTVRAAGGDDTVGYVVVRGQGDAYFAAGGDLIDLAAVRTVEETLDFAVSSRAALDAIRQSAVPVIAFVNGDALGGGAELALACDLRVMTAKARIGYVQSRLAITSAWGGGPDLVARVGPARALRMTARAEMIDAVEAVAIGLADAVVDGDLDDAGATAFFKPMDQVPRHVLVALKANVVACRSTPAYDAARAVEQDNLVATWTHAAHWAAVDRFLSRPRTAAR